MPRCEHCGRALVMPGGPVKSPFLLIGEFPGSEEIRKGMPWVGEAGKILAAEMGRAGITLARCRLTNMWLHMPNDVCDKNWHITQMKKELLGRTAVLLMGSDVLSEFLPGEMISDWNGLEIVSPELPKSIKVAVAAFNPAIAMWDKLGETRLAIQNFVDAAREYA